MFSDRETVVFFLIGLFLEMFHDVNLEISSNKLRNYWN